MESHTFPLPSPNKIHNYFIIADLHSKYMNKNSYHIFLRHIETFPVEARQVIILGDFLDFEMFFKGKDNPVYNRQIQSKYGVDDYFLPEYKDDITIGNEILDDLQRLGCKIDYALGNHEQRIYEFLKDCPMSQRHNFQLSVDLKLKERGIKLYQYPDWLDIGKISLNHGYYHNVRYLKSHFLDVMRSFAVGHLHKYQKESYKGREETYEGFSLPCMCDRNPVYMKGKPNNWNCGYTQLLVEHSGDYHLYTYNTNQKLILPSGVQIG